MSEIRKEDDFISKLTGRAKYLREKGEIKSPELLERAAAALRERAEPVSWDDMPFTWEQLEGMHGADFANGYVRGWERKCASVEMKGPLYTAPPAPVVDEWTNEQCLEFLAVAFRHAEIKGDFELDDLRLGVKMANAMTTGKEG